MLTALITWFQHRETVRQLNRLSDRELSDIGIQRSEIGSIARFAAKPAMSAVKPSVGTVRPAPQFSGFAIKA